MIHLICVVILIIQNSLRKLLIVGNLNYSTKGFDSVGGAVAVYGKGLPLTFFLSILDYVFFLTKLNFNMFSIVNYFHSRFLRKKLLTIGNLNCSTEGFDSGDGAVAVYGKGLPLTEQFLRGHAADVTN